MPADVHHDGPSSKIWLPGLSPGVDLSSILIVAVESSAVVVKRKRLPCLNHKCPVHVLRIDVLPLVLS